MKTSARILLLLLLAALVPYAALTLVAVAPQHSPIQRRLALKAGPWAVLFEQRWSFFAPPPLHNNRLYYVFVDPADGNRSLQFEALDTVLAAKRAKAPFNDTEAILDYVINGSIEQIDRFLRTKEEALAELHGAVSPDPRAAQAGPRIVPANAQIDALTTLERYAALIARANSLPPGYTRVRIIAAAAPIPPFINRLKPGAPGAEIELFETTDFDLNQV
jgi:hypothetical protein